MTKTKPAVAEATGVDEAKRALTERKIELSAIKADIASLEASLPTLAKLDDDERFESASLELGRLQRREVRAQTRVEQANEDLERAQYEAEQAGRRALYAEGQKAALEIEKLGAKYTEHATEIAKILREIHGQHRALYAANQAIPDDASRLDDYATTIQSGVRLPAANPSGKAHWWAGNQFTPNPLIDEPALRKVPIYIWHEGVYRQFDENNPEHVAASERSDKPEPLAAPAARNDGKHLIVGRLK
jgi:hypothetical protein